MSYTKLKDFTLPKYSQKNDWGTNLHRKLFAERPIKKSFYLCHWCDLLGYGSSFLKSSWDPCYEEVYKIITRLKVAHAEFVSESSIYEKTILLNDGMCGSPRMLDNLHRCKTAGKLNRNEPFYEKVVRQQV